MNNKWKIVLTFFATMVLLHIPYINVFIRAANTMFHESGHAIMTLLTSGKVQSISLFANTEGVTMSATSNWLSSILTSLSGYFFSSIVVLAFSFLCKKEKGKWILYTILTFNVINAIFWVRNIYGIFWLVAFSLLLVGLLKLKKESLISNVSLLLTMVILTDSIRASFDILYLSLQTPSQAGDVTNLQHLTLIPGVVWGTLFVLQSLIFAFFAIKMLWKEKKFKFA